MITQGKTRLIRGFEGRSGKKFDARLRLDEKWKMVFEFPERKQGRSVVRKPDGFCLSGGFVSNSISSRTSQNLPLRHRG